MKVKMKWKPHDMMEITNKQHTKFAFSRTTLVLLAFNIGVNWPVIKLTCENII